MATIYCYTGSKVSSTYFDAFFVKKYSRKYKYSLSSGGKPPANRKSIVLFTDPNAYCAYHDKFLKYPNKIVCWWHGDRKTPNKGVQKRIKIATKHLPNCKYVIVSCKHGYDAVKSFGVNESKIKKIHLGVDTNIFYPMDKISLRNKFKVPSDSFCVGSFQRDTDKRGGPKTIKGPDVFVDAIERACADMPNLFVLLSGRRREYVMKQLKKRGVNFRYVYLDDFFDMSKLYNCLDCYLMSSRVEGGPKSLMESIACNVPVVASDCGMSSEVIQDGHNGYLYPVNDVAGLTEGLSLVHGGKITSRDICITVERFDYKKSIVKKYEELFKSL